MTLSERGQFPFTQADLDRVSSYRNLAGMERLVTCEEEKGVDRALFIVVKNAGQIPVIAICSRCPCGDGQWIGRVLGSYSPHESIHISGETCGSEGFNRQARRFPLYLLTNEQKHKLADAYPNNPDLARIFLKMTG